MRTLVATVLAVSVGTTTLTAATDGWQAFTAEGVRRLRVEQAPPIVPPAMLIAQDGSRSELARYQGKVVLVEFIYTTCPVLCQQMGQAFQQVHEVIGKEGLESDVAMLSISFDLDADTPRELKAYAERHGADDTVWRIVKPARGSDLRSLLKTFGVTVIPDPLYKYQHNAAVHIVDRRGRLVRIVDIAGAAAIPAMKDALGPR